MTNDADPFPWAYSVDISSFEKSLFETSACFKVELGAGEMTTEVQCLFHKHEDLSLSPQDSHKAGANSTHL